MSLEIKAISTTVSCSVSSGEGHLSAEVDSRAWGYNGARSAYYDGDKCYVMVYKSPNVDIIKTFVTLSGATLTETAKPSGWDIKREGISFSTPIANSAKPLKGAKVTGGGIKFVKCGSPEWMPNHTVLRLKTWEATLTINAVPPAGFVFIEYEPKSEIWMFDNLKANTSLVTTEVHGVFFGLTSAGLGAFSALT